MYHLARKYHPLYIDKMNEMLSSSSSSTSIVNNESSSVIVDKGGKFKYIFNNLITIVNQCQQKYGNKTELATEQDDLVVRLCDIWEEAVSYGMKFPQLSVLKNVQEIVSGHISEPNFWEFCLRHLTNHEKERFENLRNVWTPRGKTKALIRAAFNERSLERYVLMWLNDPEINCLFEPWSLMLNPESKNRLSTMAANLSSILFAVAVDTPDINVTKTGSKKTEPMIYTSAPVGPSKKKIAVKRQIVSLENDCVNKTKDEKTNQEDEILSPYEDIPENIGKSVDSTETIAVSEDSAVDVLEHFDYQQQQQSEKRNSIKSSEGISLSHSDDENGPPKDYQQIVNNNLSVKSEISSESSYFSRQSSLQSSAGSISIKMDINQMEEKLKEMTEKCCFLEARVAELSLENRRLHRLMNHTGGNENWQFLVSIPRATLSKSGAKNYYLYEIHINFTSNLGEWIVLRRYSEFYQLHQKIKKNNTLVKALDFPPKKKFGNMDIAFVEERRQRLQIYLRHLLAILPEVSGCTTKSQLQAAFPFLRQ